MYEVICNDDEDYDADVYLEFLIFDILSDLVSSAFTPVHYFQVYEIKYKSTFVHCSQTQNEKLSKLFNSLNLSSFAEERLPL